MEQLKEQVREAASAIRNWLKEPKNKWLVGTGLLAFFYLTRLLAQFLNNWHGWAPGKELYLPSLNSLKRLVMLFTPYGVQSVIGLFAFCLIASLLYWMNKEDCSGMTYDKERKFWISNKGVYGTAGWMDQKALTNCFDLTPAEKAGEVKEIQQDIMQHLDDVLHTEPETASEQPAPQETPISDDFKLSLDELKFGRNYTGE